MAETKGATVELTQDQNEDDVIEIIMRQIGMKGFFQKRFNVVFNLVFVLLVAGPYMNIILAMAVPDHWCFVPGREKTNYTLEEWKEMTIPRTENDETFSQCSMYNVSSQSLEPTETATTLTSPVVACQNGWEYDKTWYTATIPSQENWVCDQELKITNTFAISRLGDVIGTFILGQLADNIGRRPVFFIAVFLLVGGRIMSLFVVSNFSLYLVATFVANLTLSSVFQSPLILSMEVSASDKRAQIAMMQCLGWTAGICILPMIAWMLGDWFPLMIITTLPCAAYLFLYKQFPESPRWLAARGKPQRCLKSLRYIASVNRTAVPEDTEKILEQLAFNTEKTYGLASLFSSWRLAKNTTIIVISMVVNSLAYYVLTLNVTNMAGNPFMNFFWQSFVELPAYISGRLLTDRFGRRWTQSGTFFLVPFACFFITYIVNEPGYEWLLTSLVVAVKFLITTTYYVVYLQSMEVYPTCVRQTGTSFGVVVANALGVFGPYVVYLGTAYDVRYPYIYLGLSALIGSICTAFLPETLDEKLPETLFDAQHFGEDQKFWKFEDYYKLRQIEKKRKMQEACAMDETINKYNNC